MAKCNQKLCQRTKNIGHGGACNVCEDVIKKTEAKHKKVEENRRFSRRVQIDIKRMVEINEKLSQGVKVDPDVVSNLLLNGIINIIDQNESVEEMEERIKQLEHSDITNKARLESLESWVLKQADSINKLNDKLGVMESKDIVDLNVKVLKIENDLQHVKLSSAENGALEVEKKRLSQPRKCKECDEIFSKNVEEEQHMVNVHGSEKPYSCDHCEKTFYLKWRLQKHLSVHDKGVKKCKFIRGGQECPFDNVGCMFSHENENDNEEIIEDIIENVEIEEEDEPLEDDFCYYCNNNFRNQSDLVLHMRETHMDQFYASQQDNLIHF